MPPPIEKQRLPKRCVNDKLIKSYLDILETTRHAEEELKMAEKNRSAKKANVTLAAEVLWRLDEMAATMGVSRSALVAVLVNREWNDYVDVMTKNQTYRDFMASRKTPLD